MKLTTILLALLVSASAHAQSILRNSLDTNTLGTNLVWNPSTLRLRMSGATPSMEWWNTSGTANFRRFLFSNASDQLRVEWSNDAGSSSLLLSTWSVDGNFSTVSLSLSGTTNRLTVANDVLLLDGVPVTSTASAPVNNFWSTNNFFVSGKGNTLIVTQALTIQALKTNLLATTSSGLITQAVYGSGIAWDPSTLTLSATASGDTSGTNIVTLTQSGTNLTAQMDFSLVQNGGVFKLDLTNNVHIGVPSGVSSAFFRKAWLMVRQPSTGTCYVNFTNASFAYSEGAAPINDTNAGSISVYEMVSDVWTSGIVHLSMVAKSRLLTNSVP